MSRESVHRRVRRRTARIIWVLPTLFLAACIEQDAVPADRALFVTAQDPTPCALPIAEAAAHEGLVRTRYFDGSLEIDYEFDPPDESSDLPLLFGNASFENTESDARLTYRAQRAGIALGLAGGDVSLQEREDFLREGDERWFAHVLSDGEAVGHLYALRVGRRVYIGGMVGIACDTPEEFAAMIEPRLRLLRDYAPR